MFKTAAEVINKGYKYIIIYDTPFNIINSEGNTLKLLNPFNVKAPMSIQVECINGKDIKAG